MNRGRWARDPPPIRTAPVRDAPLHRPLRRPRPPERHHRPDVDRDHPERLDPELRRLQFVQRRCERPGVRPPRDRGRRGGSGSRARGVPVDLPDPRDDRAGQGPFPEVVSRDRVRVGRLAHPVAAPRGVPRHRPRRPASPGGRRNGGRRRDGGLVRPLDVRVHPGPPAGRAEGRVRPAEDPGLRLDSESSPGELDQDFAPDRQPELVDARPRVVPVSPDFRVLARLHARGGRQGPVLRGSQPLRDRNARDRERGQLPAAPDLLGDHGPLLVPADWLLVLEAGGRRGGEEGVPRDPGGGRPVPRGCPGHLERVRHLVLQRNPREDGEPLPEHPHAAAPDPDPAAAVRRGRRQERAVPAPRVAPRCDGGPDHGQRVDPRGDDGQGRRLPNRPCVHFPRSNLVGDPAALHRHPRDRGDRRFHDALRRDDGRRELRHQAGPRVLDDLPARLHVPRPRRGRVHDGDRSLPRGDGGLHRIQRGAVPSVQPRVLQGPPVPRRRERDPRGPHESPRVMTAPLIILAGFTLASGLLAYPMGGFGNLIFSGAPAAGLPLVGIPAQDYLLEGVSMGVAVLGLALAWAVYATKRIPAERFTASRGGAFIHRMLTKRYWIDDAYDAFGRTVVYDAARALDWFDRKVIDGIVNGVGRGGVVVAAGSDRFDRRVIDGAVNAVSLETVRTSLRLRQRQTGQVQSYAWVVVLGIVVVIALAFGLSFLQRWLAGLGR